MSYTALDDALSTLSRSLGQRSRSEKVDVREAYGRVLAEPVLARKDSPARDVSHFDGYAVSHSDTLGASVSSPVTLAVERGSVAVGVFPRARLAPGRAARVLTGGYLPPGADAVVALEDVERGGDGIRLVRPVEKGEHVYPAGADVRKGETVLSAGKTLMAQDTTLLVSMPVRGVAVFAKPRVRIIPTGGELTSDIGDRRRGKVVESHSIMLERLVEAAGGLASTSPIVPDEKSAISRALDRALATSEIVFTLAGSSLGDRDLVESAIHGFGRATTALVHGIRVNRGRVMGFAVVRGKPVVILPGPIQGALNAFIVIAYPLIRYHLGLGWEMPPAVGATVAEEWEATGKFRDFLQVVYLRLRRDPSHPGELFAVPSGAQTEKISFLVSQDGYALLSGENPRLSKGQRVAVHLLPGFSRL